MIHEGVEAFLLGQSKTIPVEAAQFAAVIKETKKNDPLVEHQIGFDQNWGSVGWSNAWGKSVIDAGYLKGRIAHINEWKSGKVYDDHADQRRLYGTLGPLIWPDVDEINITTCYFDQGIKKKLTLTHEHMKDIRDDFSRRVYFMELDDVLAPRPSWLCKWCDFSRTKDGPCKNG